MDWRPDELRAWHAARAPDLSWLDRPARHLFRWRDAWGAWRVSPRRFPRPDALARALRAAAAKDAYVGTAAWLDPVDLPRRGDRARPPPVLLDHLVVFDVDRAPYCLPSLERARRAVLDLLAWTRERTRLEILHVVFSGGKGFHVVARDPDRAPFRVEDPREREDAVRAVRARVLADALAAGHDVDPTVTADTRRVVRLPGTLHGGTGWAASVVDEATLRRPVKDWLHDLPRHPRALRPPRLAPLRLPRLRRAAGPAPRGEDAPRLELQASTHVVGTSDRQALLCRVPLRRAQEVARALDAHALAPALLWRDGESLLVLVPRALPRDALLALGRRARLPLPRASIERLGHAWVGVAPRQDADLAPLPRAQPPRTVACAHPWSRPHLELARRLGQAVDGAEGPACGADAPALRLAQLR